MFLTYILPILLLTYRDGHALPVYCTPSSNATWDSGMLAVTDSTRTQSQPPRTLFSVVWSCILTVFICAWTSVHPNVPPQSRMGGLLARVKLMFWTIVAPELVLAWAVRQWFAAKEVRDVCNRRKQWRCWTKEHGHFLIMGGYQLVNEDFKKYEGSGSPGWIALPQDWGTNSDCYPEYERRRRESTLGVLTLEHFKILIEDPDFEFPRITAAEIKDRSKGDGLSKLIAILQTSWFILQCIARGFQGLALTELELVTLAMASLNAITFMFWWGKPLAVQEPVNVYITAKQTKEAVSKKGESNEQEDVVVAPGDVMRVHELGHAFAHTVVGFFAYPDRGVALRLAQSLVVIPYSLLFIVTWPVFVLFPLGILLLLQIIKTEQVERIQDNKVVASRVVFALLRARYKLTHSIRRHFGRSGGPLGKIVDKGNDYHSFSFITDWFFFIPASFFLLVLLLGFLSPLFTLFLIASFNFTAVFEIVTTHTVLPGATHVPSFYAPRTKSDRYSRMIVFAIFGVIFGGIHCIGWNFIFPTHSERFIWRYTSVVLTVIPFVAAPIDCVLENVKLDNKFRKKVRLVLDMLITALLFVYVPARLSLIAQAVALLRDQPSTAFVAVDWTKYIPHLFN